MRHPSHLVRSHTQRVIGRDLPRVAPSGGCVVACVVPFNFPFMVPMWTTPIALVAGNCVILKPSEKARPSPQRSTFLAPRRLLPPAEDGTPMAAALFEKHCGRRSPSVACIVSQVPMTMARVSSLLTEAGVPSGVFQLVHGGQPVVESLCDHPEIAALTFVGSSRVAKLVSERNCSVTAL